MPSFLNRICCCVVGGLPEPIKYFLRSLLFFACVIDKDENISTYWGVKDEDFPLETGCCKVSNKVQFSCLEFGTCNNVHCCDYTCYSFDNKNYCQCILGAIVSVPVFLIRWILSILLAIILIPLAILLLIFGIILMVVVVILFVPFISCLIILIFLGMLTQK